MERHNTTLIREHWLSTYDPAQQSRNNKLYILTTTLAFLLLYNHESIFYNRYLSNIELIQLHSTFTFTNTPARKSTSSLNLLHQCRAHTLIMKTLIAHTSNKFNLVGWLLSNNIKSHKSIFINQILNVLMCVFLVMKFLYSNWNRLVDCYLLLTA